MVNTARSSLEASGRHRAGTRSIGATDTKLSIIVLISAAFFVAGTSMIISMSKLGASYSSVLDSELNLVQRRQKEARNATSPNYAKKASHTNDPVTDLPTKPPSISPTTNPPTTKSTSSVNYTNNTLNKRGEIVSDFKSISPLQCPKNICPENQCPIGVPRIPYISIQDDGHTMNKMNTYVSENWGNVLSPYWAARAMAELGGYQYRGNTFGRGSWMEFLPTTALARASRKDVFENVCRTCTSYEFFHKGECSEGWSSIAPAVMEDTQRAILEHSKKSSEEEKNAIFNFFNPNDWLIYNRCVVFRHSEHSPGVLRTYDAIPTEGEFSVYVMMGRNEDSFNLCNILVNESIEYMKRRNPSINVTILATSSLFVDFGRLVFAPNVLVASRGSSWALWSAVLANSNNVVSLPMLPNSSIASLPGRVKFLVDVPTLLNPEDFESATSAYGIPPGKFSNTTEDREAVLRYFRGDIA
ncbi:hypothetical protein HJC23_008709 [Cyclotella cryptica]|uniref:Uncharacterized protein n=1 Tax=Cyclotella cryptica TaxID=29204 RepID=A0ABD3QHE4_9STRA|eukprot:CCRYP_005433-RA/>CCRYP_005433-RA protein AED:0.00 eAED:0.00 QI:172/-1/1/1/-1/1/1/105/470